MDLTDIRRARSVAQRQIEIADQAVRETCKLAAGRLRIADVPGYILRELKLELRGFNMHTGRWKDE